MIKYEDALKIAKTYHNDINICTEYSNAYIFGWDDDEHNEIGLSPVVVLKENGKAVTMSWYILHVHGKEVGSFKI